MWEGKAVARLLLVFLAVLGSGCGFTIPPGNPTDHFVHRFEITYQGERLKGWNGGDDELVFSANPDDFESWERWVDYPTAVDGKAPVFVLVPKYQIEIVFDDPDWDRLCLTDAMIFFDSETLEEVYEIPAGTCLENGGTTVIDILE